VTTDQLSRSARYLKKSMGAAPCIGKSVILTTALSYPIQRAGTEKHLGHERTPFKSGQSCHQENDGLSGNLRISMDYQGWELDQLHLAPFLSEGIRPQGGQVPEESAFQRHKMATEVSHT
jgi:hypothetical protein